jgi:hypothetical protein
MLRILPLALLLAGCASAYSTRVSEPETRAAAPSGAEMDALRSENVQLRQRIKELEFWIAQYREMPADQPGASLVLEEVKDFILLPGEVYDRVGLESWVYLRRGDQYVGRARILQHTSRGTTARFDTEFPGPAAPPRVGDVVVSLPVR